MVVYPSHRDFGFQDRMVEKVRWNAAHTELINDAESIRNFTGGAAFPIPQGPEEVLWNTRTNACHTSYEHSYDGYGVFANGERAHDAVYFRTSSPFNNPDYPIPTTGCG